ncbi:hypothetical protein STENM327S_04781 [Streptomyces tendae]
MDRVFPRHADAAVQLQRLLGGVDGDLGRVRLGHGHRHVGVRTGRQGVGRVPGGGAQTGHLQPQPGEPMLERLEAADLSVELLAFLEVADRLGQQPVGETQLLGGEQPGTGREGPAHGGFRVPEAAPGGTGEGHPRQWPGGVERHLGSDGHVGGADRVQAPVVGGHEQHVGEGGVGDAGQLPVQRARFETHPRDGAARRDVQSDRERGDGRGGRQLAEQVVGPAGQHRLGGDDGARQVRHRCDRPAQLLQDHGSFAVGGTLPAQFLRDQQAREAHRVGEGLPQRHVVRGGRLGAGDDARRVAVVGEQVPDGGPQRLFLLRQEQSGFLLCAHRARSFHATSLSVRGSAGRPRTRSATMFSRTSLVPPSMLLPLERR